MRSAVSQRADEAASGRITPTLALAAGVLVAAFAPALVAVVLGTALVAIALYTTVTVRSLAAPAGADRTPEPVEE